MIQPRMTAPIRPRPMNVMIATPTMMPMNNTPRPVKNIPGIARSAPRLSAS
jgi:hypothetical protein